MRYVLNITVENILMLFDDSLGGRRPTPDDVDIFRHLARQYSYAHPVMHLGSSCPGDYEQFNEGITSGVSWYPVKG
jgi:carboxypeptidase D